MNVDRLRTKLEILSGAAKYDVSCSSSGGKRRNPGNGLGDSSASGICHSFTEDGRCVSLLKILLTNHCIFDCAYCVSRRSNDVPRAGFTVEEVVELTMDFYRRNYIEGLFLSSGIFKDADTTMERLVRVAKTLRTEHRFYGYIHLKGIPGASDELMREAGRYADRLSVNMEIPTQSGLKLLAPEKDHASMLQPMATVRQEILAHQDSRKHLRTTPRFAPAGQSTQLIIGATPETDLQVITLADRVYRQFGMRRVYYSGYVPMLEDKRLPALSSAVPMVRENRLYQADWLMRFYGFAAQELLDPQQPFLDLELDPKTAWALRHLEDFPVNIQTAPLEHLLRIPGIGVRTARRMVQARRFERLTLEHLQRMGAVLRRARYFLYSPASPNPWLQDYSPERLRAQLLAQATPRRGLSPQLSLFDAA